MPPKHNSQRVDDLLASVTEDLLMGAPQRSPQIRDERTIDQHRVKTWGFC